MTSYADNRDEEHHVAAQSIKYERGGPYDPYGSEQSPRDQNMSYYSAYYQNRTNNATGRSHYYPTLGADSQYGTVAQYNYSHGGSATYAVEQHQQHGYVPTSRWEDSSDYYRSYHADDSYASADNSSGQSRLHSIAPAPILPSPAGSFNHTESGSYLQPTSGFTKTSNDGSDYMSPESDDYDNSVAGTSQGMAAANKKFQCTADDCIAAFNRKADMERHYHCVHNKTVNQKFNCEVPQCGRVGNLGFTRKDHLREHLRNYHHQDIPKRRRASHNQTMEDEDY